MSENRIILSQPTEIDIRGKVYTIYPISIADFVSLEKHLSKLEKEKNIAELGKLITEVAYIILTKGGNNVKKEEVAEVVTIEAFQYLVKAALGTSFNLGVLNK